MICMLLMQVPYVHEGLEAIIFTADGDMRQALNNLQATHFGFGLVDAAAVFKACLIHFLMSLMSGCWQTLSLTILSACSLAHRQHTLALLHCAAAAVLCML